MTHSQVRNFVCSDCGERFRSKGQVELHATRRHNPDMKPTIPCEECGKLFRIQADLRNHLSRTHRARLERKHRCFECDLTFRTQVCYYFLICFQFIIKNTLKLFIFSKA